MEVSYPFNRTRLSEPNPAQLVDQPSTQVRGPAPLSPGIRSRNEEKKRWASPLLAELVRRKKEMGSIPMQPSSL
ncbi:hypothetical protein V6N12_057168 [Hibiscus sabdariffa]|uniref:Uncharacterized protein n=1 Tax=Hibiscus sabdariffa TaxID=183260 RepID=A0ABR2A764_9ROSI